MRLRLHPRLRQDPQHLLPQQRDGARVAVVGAGRKEAEEHPPTHHTAGIVAKTGDDDIGVLRAVHQASHIGLGDAHRRQVAEHGAHSGRQFGQAVQRVEHRQRWIAQHAEILAPRHRRAARVIQRDAAMAEQDEIVVGQPAQELRAFAAADLLLRLSQPGEHGREIADGEAHIRHRAGQGVVQRVVIARLRRQPASAQRRGDPRGEGDPHHALPRTITQRQQPAFRIAADGQDGVQQAAHHAALHGQSGKGAVHQEGHVVGDDLHHLGAAASGSGGQDAQLGLPRGTLGSEGEEAGGGLRQGFGRHLGQFGGRYPLMQAPQQRRGLGRQIGGGTAKRGLRRRQHARAQPVFRAGGIGHGETPPRPRCAAR